MEWGARLQFVDFQREFKLWHPFTFAVAKKVGAGSVRWDNVAPGMADL